MEFKDIVHYLIEQTEEVEEDFEVPGYPELPTEKSPPEIKKFLRRIVEEKSEEEIKNQILLYKMLGTGTPEYKMSKEASEYTDQASGHQKCINCEFLYQKVPSGEYICSQIRGKVEPEGWCNQWKKADALKGEDEE